MLGSHRNPTEQSPLLLVPPSWHVLCGLFLQNMWIERTIYTTAYKLPGILRWFEVKSVFMVRRLLRRKYPPSSFICLTGPPWPQEPCAHCGLFHSPYPSVPVTTLHVPQSINISLRLLHLIPKAAWPPPGLSDKKSIPSHALVMSARSCIALTGLLTK